ncbi:hypothetical protein [Streptomyces scopuliridis]|uniref:hypothetical protein n=1 Tax=Streptomyces scopuliridis TaxID=452529 RepID=UPI003F57FA62
MITVTVLHPGTMGVAITAEIVAGGHEALSVTKGRSENTWLRGREAGATAYDSLAEALSRSAVVLSVCPPQAAEDVAAAVAAHGFAGVYADVNAISPQRVRRIVDEIRPGSAAVDGAVFGQPPGEGGATRLYLAGADSAVELVASPCGYPRAPSPHTSRSAPCRLSAMSVPATGRPPDGHPQAAEAA